MHLSEYTSTQLVPAELQVHIDNTVSVGSFVAVLDEDTDKKYHIAKVLDVAEQQTTLHYYATKGNRLRGAIWRPVYTIPRTNTVVMDHAPDTINRNHVHYTGVIPTRPIDDSLIILPNVGMTPRLRVNARCREILLTKTGYSHHIYGRTWSV